ncbi:F-box/kelch-repeat protein At1g55270-like [Phragmites australis]|uniref:F-box/kelch-repeat protein At1g55270-like n=1 Tax=Phragmites australis TaxID=29695 RepID=UPI002D792316|nr:F-box/kelch-repeat protein At1g55270-like [Phragmites australis]
MDRRNRSAPLVDTLACLCRVNKSSAAAAARRIPVSKACVQPSLMASIHPLKLKASPRQSDRSRGGQCPLLPSLPDDLAIACLIRVPRAEHWKLRLVCRRWFRLLAGNYFYSLRRRLGLAEQWVYAVKRDRDGRVSWDVLDPARGTWRALPPVPHEYANADGFGCAVLGGCHLYLLGGTDPLRGPMRRVVFYSARSNRWHRSPDMLRRRYCFGACVMGNRLYVAGGESGGGGGGLRSAEVFDPAKNRWSFLSDMAAAMVPFVSAVHGGRWYVKGLSAQQEVLSQVYSPEADAWSVVLDGMVTGWRSPSACLDGRLFAADCKDGCRLRAYDEALDAWTTCFESKQHEGSSQAAEAAAIVALHGKLCVVRNDMSVSAVDVAAGAGNQRWETLAGKARVKSFVTDLLPSIAGRGRAKNHILHCQVLEA